MTNISDRDLYPYVIMDRGLLNPSTVSALTLIMGKDLYPSTVLALTLIIDKRLLSIHQWIETSIHYWIETSIH